MVDVFRRKSSALDPRLYPGYAFHGVTAVATLVLLSKALGY